MCPMTLTKRLYQKNFCTVNNQLFFNVAITISGRLFILKGKILFPIPLLTIILVLLSSYRPLVYLGNIP